MDTTIGNNIRILRKTYGETQFDLAMAIGVDSPSTISMYENNERIPERDILIRIAKHYKITIDELIYSKKKNKLEIPDEKVSDMQYNIKMINSALPILSDDDYFNNHHFKNAYILHMTLYHNLENGIISTEELDKCVKEYKCAIDEGCIEACANLIWWDMITMFCLSFSNSKLLSEMEIAIRNGKTIKDSVKNIYLPAFDDETTNVDIEIKKEREEYRDNHSVDVLKNIYLLKHSDKYSELADYYLGLCCFVGFLGSDLPDELRNTTALEMIYAFSIIGNEYAKNFIQKK